MPVRRFKGTATATLLIWQSKIEAYISGNTGIDVGFLAGFGISVRSSTLMNPVALLDFANEISNELASRQQSPDGTEIQYGEFGDPGTGSATSPSFFSK